MPGAAKVAVVTGEVASANSTGAGPLSAVQRLVRAPEVGKLSSLIVPARATEAGKVMVTSGPASTRGGRLAVNRQVGEPRHAPCGSRVTTRHR